MSNLVTPNNPRQTQHQVITTNQGPRVGPYIFGRTLGTGSTGKVKLAKNLETNQIVAIKIVRRDYLHDKPSLRKKMRREITVLSLLTHPNLMSLIDVFEIETHIFLVMEYVDGLELFEFLVRKGPLPYPTAMGFFQQIICGLEYCHRRLICHRDLKPENLLLDRNFNIKIADFGMTSLSKPDKLLETSCGSPHYCDPAVVSGEMYDGRKADIWSCGVILYAMVTGRLPFDDNNIQRLLQKVQTGQYHLPSELPTDLRDLIRRMLTVDPQQRITLDEIKEHPAFTAFPPRNYVQDDFESPEEPIRNPDLRVVQSLVDLGWGDTTQVLSGLATEGSNMEKVFYMQLAEHPRFKQSDPPALSALNNSRTAEAQGTQTVDSEPQEEEPVQQPEQNGNGLDQQPSADADTGATAATAPPKTTDEELQQQFEAVSVADNSAVDNTDNRAEEEITTPGRQSRTNLVRQSSLVRLNATEGTVPTDDGHVEEAIQNASEASRRSWFDSFRTYITGGESPNQQDDQPPVGDNQA